MAVIRIYRKFYKITVSKTGELYDLIDPIEINAFAYLKDTAHIVEDSIAIIKESVGVYYADLNPHFYSYDNTYDLKWNVNYVENSPIKILATTFKLNPVNINNSICTEIDETNVYTEIDNKIIEVIIL